jgi:hypothetical protein
MTVVETPSFLRDAASVLGEREKAELVFYLAANPDAGDIMPDTGGVSEAKLPGVGTWEKRWPSRGLLLPQ